MLALERSDNSPYIGRGVQLKSGNDINLRGPSLHRGVLGPHDLNIAIRQGSLDDLVHMFIAKSIGNILA